MPAVIDRVQPPAPVVRTVVQPAHVAAATPRVVSVYVDPPLYQPPPVAVAWAPPPMLVEVPPPSPFAGAVWTGGYWTWQGNWVWAAGRWSAPPQPGYAWVQPYYEHRDNVVVFVAGHWSAPGVAFVPPPLGLSIAVSVAAAGVVAGVAPIGPPGVFVPAPPGSRLGLIVPAPIGTPPAVVVSAPPVTNVGMRVQNTTISNVTNNTTINNITNVTKIVNNNQTVKVMAPASATASGRPFEAAIPASAHLAAALPPVVRAMAPVPASAKPVAALPADRRPPPEARSVEAVRAAPVGNPSAQQGTAARPPSQPQPPLATQAHHEPQVRPDAQAHGEPPHPATQSRPEPLLSEAPGRRPEPSIASPAPAQARAEMPPRREPNGAQPQGRAADADEARMAHEEHPPIAAHEGGEQKFQHPPRLMPAPAPRPHPPAPAHGHAEHPPAAHEHAAAAHKKEHGQ
ncbi:hypothetical protein [uncultured Variovorax sp.]|uniref:hypothetical protein n=1 Tax=uncultured Variovorax sp. TaxID=114708 RepID=UPI0025E1D0F0|nr:hypothetical protein [uncultured Variovorax sp.]